MLTQVKFTQVIIDSTSLPSMTVIKDLVAAIREDLPDVLLELECEFDKTVGSNVIKRITLNLQDLYYYIYRYPLFRVKTTIFPLNFEFRLFQMLNVIFKLLSKIRK